MIRSRRNLDVIVCLIVLIFGVLYQLRAETIVLHLKNGDRLAGTIISEDTNRVLITTSWTKELAVPLDQIVSRESLAAEQSHTNAVAKIVTPVTETREPGPPPTNVVQAAKSTNLLATAALPTAVKPARPKRWKGEAKVGADFIFNANNQQIYYGRFKLSYERPYASNPKKFFRNIFDYSVDYGRTEGVTSANQMNGSDKTDFDLRKRWYVYNLGGAGYDKIRKIDLHYEEGPGLGYHLLTLTNFVLDVEAGANYQVQDRSDNTSSEKFFYRLAELVTWKLHKRLTLTEKAEYFPQVEDVGQFRARLEANLSYGIWANLSLNVSLLDLYDTQPAHDVPRNDLQVRSSIGITF
jgi:hypothetical protein